MESCFCYTSTKTGVIFAHGNPRLHDVFPAQAANITGHMDFLETGGRDKENYILPRLPVPVKEMNGPMLKTVVINLGKDLGVSFKDTQPTWWPEQVPFCNPWKGRDNFGRF